MRNAPVVGHLSRLLASVLGAVLAIACGGGSSSSPSSPSAPSTPTGSTVTVYGSLDRYVDSLEAGRVFQPPSAVNVGVVFLYGGDRRFSLTQASALKFDLPAQVTGRTVTRATLRLTVLGVRTDVPLGGPTKTMNIQFRVNAFTTDWDPTSLSWNVWSSLGYQSDGEALAPAPNSPEPPVVIDLTTIVRNWASGAWRNYGLRLAVVPYADPGGESYGITNFYSTDQSTTDPNSDRS